MPGSEGGGAPAQDQSAPQEGDGGTAGLARTHPGRDAPAAGRSFGVNDFALKIATVNGTGSASANALLLQAIFRMGVPVSGKNLFPSNIQGLPTWYEIRANGEGHTCRTDVHDLMVAMNPATYRRDVDEVRSGGWILHDSTWPFRSDLIREDATYLGIPLAKMCVDRFSGARERILMKNIGYVGALAALLDLEVATVEQLLEENFGRKKALLESNFEAFRMGYDHALEHFDCPLAIRLERMEQEVDHVLMDGNTAAALGCLFAGATVAAWYPITPSTSLVDAFSAFCDAHRKEPETGRNRFAIVQAEDELAAAGMVIGAGWAGARAFTATSGPGISLMSEFIGLAYYAEIPSVFFDIQRTGPSTGMPTRTQQGDLNTVVYASHGDTRHIALFPADPGECFDFAAAAFDLAERFQTPVFVVSDLDIGMNDWMIPPLEWDDDYRPDRGKVLSAEELEEAESFSRYLDVDGDGIPYRTLPGVHPKGAYFTRGSGHDAHARYTEDAEPYTEVVDRIDRKVRSTAEHVPAPEVWWAGRGRPGTAEGAGADARPAAASGGARGGPGAGDGHGADAVPYGIVTVGGCRGAVLEARERLSKRGIDTDFLRVRGFPFAPSIADFVAAHERVFVVEQNRDAQLLGLLVTEARADRDRLVSVRRYGGLPLAAGQVVEGIVEASGPSAEPAREEGGARAGPSAEKGSAA